MPTPQKFSLVRSSIALWIAALAVLLAPRLAEAHADLLAMIDSTTRRIEANPNNASLYFLRGELYRAHADWALAENDYDQAAQLDSKLAEIDLARGKLLFESGHPIEARAKLNQYLAAHANDVDALIMRAQLLAKLGKNQASAIDFTRAIAHAPAPRADHFLERAKVQASSGDIKSALEGLDEGLQRLGPLVALQLYAIELECAREQFDLALSRLETISARAPRKETWLVRRGEILLMAHRRVEAEITLKAALSAIDELAPRLQQAPTMVELQKRAQAALRKL
jgi:tetratricopeptide (TPR) repeat protein